MPHIKLYMCSLEFKIPTFFLHLQIHLSLDGGLLSTSTPSPALCMYALRVLLQKMWTGLSLAQFAAFKSKHELEGSQKCLLSNGTYLIFHVFIGFYEWFLSALYHGVAG